MTGCRPAPALAASAVIGVAVVLALRGVAATVAPAQSTEPTAPLLGTRLRIWYRELLTPLEAQLAAWRVHPDALTWAQLATSALAGAAFAAGWVFLAGWLTILAGTLDVLDGGLARRVGLAGPRGALVDSVVDRWSEFITYLGLGVLFGDGWLLVVVVLAAFASFMVSYTRARAEGLGLRLDEGSAQRPERYVILGLGAALSGIVSHLACAFLGRPTHAVLGLAVVVLAGLATWTALQRGRQAAHGLARGGTR